MNRVIIGIISMFAGAIIVYKNDNIIIQGLMDENKILTDIVERLKYDNNKMDKLLKKKFLKESFDILKYNMCIKKPKTTDDEILIKYDSSDSDSDSDSNSFQDFNQINELSESLNSELESLNSDDSSKSKIDPSLSNLV